MPDTVSQLDWLSLVMGLAGGLALFLIGMGRVTASLKTIAGDRLRGALARLSSNRIAGAATGAGVTAVIQSSSVTSVLVVGFVSANLLSLTQASSVIVGSHLGTTVTAQVIAFDVTRYALGMLGIGALVGAVADREQWRQLGAMVAGLGFVFFGLGVMSEAMEPLGSYQPFLDLLADDQTPLMALLAGAGFTALVQSSSATTGIVVVMAAQGLVGLETGIAIVLGAAIGTCVTALLAAIGRPPDAVRAAVVHVVVNTVGALVAVVLIAEIASVVTWLSPSPAVSGGEGPGATPRQIAHAATVFHAVNTVVFLVLLGPVVRFARRVVPETVGPAAPEVHEPLALDWGAVGTPVLALESARRATLQVGMWVRDMVERALPVATGGTKNQLDDLEAMDDWVDDSHAALVDYLREVSRGPLDDDQRGELLGLLEMANELEQLADLVETNLVATGRARLGGRVSVSEQTMAILGELHGVVIGAIDDSLAALGERDAAAADRVVDSKARFKDLEEVMISHLAERLAAPEPQRVAAYSVEVELVEGLRRAHGGCRRIARAARRSIITEDEPVPGRDPG
ncbi:MAG: Na/Pi cotransporter family protein [Acidimicrobiales bacterium]|nr:Na/Pi cotransporter family protein [Acidimicrobiales bacterium]